MTHEPSASSADAQFARLIASLMCCT